MVKNNNTESREYLTEKDLDDINRTLEKEDTENMSMEELNEINRTLEKEDTENYRLLKKEERIERIKKRFLNLPMLGASSRKDNEEATISSDKKPGVGGQQKKALPGLDTLKKIEKGKTEEDKYKIYSPGGVADIDETIGRMEGFNQFIKKQSELKGTIMSELVDRYKGIYGQTFASTREEIVSDQAKFIDEKQKELLNRPVKQLGMPELGDQTMSILSQLATGIVGQVIQGAAPTRAVQQNVSSAVIAGATQDFQKKQNDMANLQRSIIEKNINLENADADRKQRILSDMSKVESSIVAATAQLYSTRLNEASKIISDLQGIYTRESSNFFTAETMEAKLKMANQSKDIQMKTNAIRLAALKLEVKKLNEMEKEKNMKLAGYGAKDIEYRYVANNLLNISNSPIQQNIRTVRENLDYYKHSGAAIIAKGNNIKRLYDNVYAIKFKELGGNKWSGDKKDTEGKIATDSNRQGARDYAGRIINDYNMLAANGYNIDPDTFLELSGKGFSVNQEKLTLVPQTQGDVDILKKHIRQQQFKGDVKTKYALALDLIKRHYNTKDKVNLTPTELAEQEKILTMGGLLKKADERERIINILATDEGNKRITSELVGRLKSGGGR